MTEIDAGRREGTLRIAETMALCEALRLTRETTATVDGRILRDATCDLVAGLKLDGLPIERIISRVKTLAKEAGFPPRQLGVAGAQDEHFQILLDEVIRICVETYYR